MWLILAQRQVFYQPTDRSSTDPLTTNPQTNAPPTHQSPTTNDQPTNKCSTDPPTTDRRLTNRFTTNSPTQWRYYNWPTTLWLANLILTDQFFQQSNSIHHSEWVPFITELVKIFIKWLIKKNVDKLQILLVIPFGNRYLRIGI